MFPVKSNRELFLFLTLKLITMKSIFNPNDKDQLLARITNLKNTSQPLWGKMTVNEMICHVSDPFRDFLKIRTIKTAVPFFLRPLLKMMVLGKKPFGKNQPTVKPYLQSSKGGGTKSKGFETDVEELKNLINKFVFSDSNMELGNHGALGVLTKEQAGLYSWKHLDHHLGQFGV
jgi:hypothetical protein